jgi:hypothetical protein
MLPCAGEVVGWYLQFGKPPDTYTGHCPTEPARAYDQS